MTTKSESHIRSQKTMSLTLDMGLETWNFLMHSSSIPLLHIQANGEAAAIVSVIVVVD